MHIKPPFATSNIEEFDGDEGSYIRFIGFFDLFAPSSASLSDISAHTREAVDTIVAFHA